MTEIGSKYKHYKGNEYIVLNIAKHTETKTLEELVIYQDLSDNSKIWARPKKMFEDSLIVNDEETKRFTKI